MKKQEKKLTALVSEILGCSLLLMKPEAHFNKLEFQPLPYKKNQGNMCEFVLVFLFKG